MNLLIELSPISRTRPGCQAISLRRNEEDPTNIIGDTRWDSRQDYDNYLAWRTDSGYTAQFEEMLAQPMSIRYRLVRRVHGGRAGRDGPTNVSSR